MTEKNLTDKEIKKSPTMRKNTDKEEKPIDKKKILQKNLLTKREKITN